MSAIKRQSLMNESSCMVEALHMAGCRRPRINRREIRNFIKLFCQLSGIENRPNAPDPGFCETRCFPSTHFGKIKKLTLCVNFHKSFRTSSPIRGTVRRAVICLNVDVVGKPFCPFLVEDVCRSGSYRLSDLHLQLS